MSFQSWCNEFYRKPARRFQRDAPEEEIEAVEHSLRKWIGLRKENLEKHGLQKRNRTIEPVDIDIHNSEYLGIDGGSCALCSLFVSNVCAYCPLAKVRGGTRCDEMTSDERLQSEKARADPDEYLNLTSPYMYWTATGDPEPMISWLEKARELVTGGPEPSGDPYSGSGESE